MTNLLYISASPRGEQSAPIQAAQVFLNALPEGVGVERIDLFERELPPVTLEITAAKQKAFMGMAFTDEETCQWAAIVDLIDEFKAADHYLMAVPMWNFNVPYKFKQYIDLLTHPGLTFTRDDAIQGLFRRGYKRAARAGVGRRHAHLFPRRRLLAEGRPTGPLRLPVAVPQGLAAADRTGPGR